MLPQRYKIKGKAVLTLVFERGKRVKLETRSPFSLRYIKRAAGGPKFAIAIPSQLKLKAVSRNKTRRRLFEAIRLNLPFTNGKNCDIVITVHRQLDAFDFEDIQAIFKSLIEKIT